MLRSCLFPILVFFAGAIASGGCATAEHQVLSPVPCTEPRGVIFAADGAGGFAGTSKALREAVEMSGLPLRVETLQWSHGYGRVLADQISLQHIHDEGAILAAKVAALRAECPDIPVYLLGHSAGSAVVLAAAEMLPPQSVEGIAILSPSVCSDYDLRPALRASRRGIDVFYSRRDWAYLGIAVTLVGTSDGHWFCRAAGRVGFNPETKCPDDACLFEKLRQHPWDSSMSWTGNRGGHYGGHHPRFLQAYVLPQFADCDSCAAAH